MRKIAMLIAVLFCCTMSVLAQKTIRGKVTDSKDNTPLAAVTVKIKGTNIGTSSGTDGTYTLDVPAANANGTLEFSLVGYGL